MSVNRLGWGTTNTVTVVTSEADSTSLEPVDVYWTSLLTWTLSCFSLPPTFNTLREFALFMLKIKQQQHNMLESVAGVRSTGLPSIPRTHFFHIDSSQLSHQFLAASAYRFPEFGEGAAALQVIESILSWASVLSSRPAGTTFPWTGDRQHVKLWTVHTWNQVRDWTKHSRYRFIPSTDPNSFSCARVRISL